MTGPLRGPILNPESEGTYNLRPEKTSAGFETFMQIDTKPATPQNAENQNKVCGHRQKNLPSHGVVCLPSSQVL